MINNAVKWKDDNVEEDNRRTSAYGQGGGTWCGLRENWKTMNHFKL